MALVMTRLNDMIQFEFFSDSLRLESIIYKLTLSKRHR